MASRPVFVSKNCFPFYDVKHPEFEWFPGFSPTQKKKSIEGLHRAFSSKYPEKKVLEVSTKGENPVGNKLSAFNLKLPIDGKEILLECVFQGGKVFTGGGPYTDLYDVSPKDAKRDERLKESGRLKWFKLGDEVFPLDPTDYFYSWIYAKAVYSHPDLLETVKTMEYNAFTDIEFNPDKSVNCQAKTLAKLKGMSDAGVLDEAMESKERFLEIMYQYKP